MRQLSEYTRQFDVIDLIKMDIEGAEGKVVKELGETNALANTRQYVIEYHHSTETNQGELADFLDTFSKQHFNFKIVEAYLNLPKQQDIIFRFWRRDLG